MSDEDYRKLLDEVSKLSIRVSILERLLDSYESFPTKVSELSGVLSALIERTSNTVKQVDGMVTTISAFDTRFSKIERHMELILWARGLVLSAVIGIVALMGNYLYTFITARMDKPSIIQSTSEPK